jgi:hypothetical protein
MGGVIVRRSIVLFAIIAFYLCICPRVSAVPAWARKTGLPCLSCHVGGSSRLTQLGRDFQQRGHQLQGGSGKSVRTLALLDYATLSAKFRHSEKQDGPTSSQLQTGSLLAGGPLTSRLGFFAEYMWHDRLADGRSTSGLMDAYAQYVSSRDADRFWWARAGNIYPYAVYMMGGGGRAPLSRPRLITDELGGVAPPLMRRATGISGGYYGGKGWQFEGGVQQGDGAEGASRAESFFTVERDFDEFGTAVGLMGRTGWNDTGSVPATRFSQAGILARWADEKYGLSGAYLMTRGRDAVNNVRRPDGFYLEANANVLPETTAFLRYDDVTPNSVTASRSHTLAGGVTQRIPGTGRVVFEVWDYRIGNARQRTFQLDLLLMY